MNTHSCLMLAAVCLGLGSSKARGEETVVDVNMPSPFVQLPLYLEQERHPPYVAALIADGRVRQVSGPAAEVLTAYRTDNRTWAVWAKLPEQTGEYVFAKKSEIVRVTVTGDDRHAYTHRVLVQAVQDSTGAAEAVSSALIQRAILLPIAGPVTQVSGPETVLLPDLSSKGKVWAKIPDQVCTLVFETKGRPDRAVVRVWADKDACCFVSANRGDDGHPGTEAKPFKTLSRAVNHLKEKPEIRGGIYMAGGEYDLGDTPLVLNYRMSLFGGFDESGWRREPMITAPVLLPNGFRENWIDDISDRFKDLRRAEPRYRETVLRRRTDRKISTILLGGGSNPGSLEIAGTPDTYIDGVTIIGPDENNRADVNIGLDTATQNKRTVRNCILIHVCGGGHNFLTATCGDGLFENNLVWGGIDSPTNNTRPQITGTFGQWRRNLIVGPTGGSYTRILACWGEGGTFTENQIHGGTSTGWTGMQAAHRATLAERPNVFRRNVFYLDYLFNDFMAAGLVMEENEIYLFKGGALGQLMASRCLTIRNNRFHLAPHVSKEGLWPKQMTKRLGGKFDFEERRYIEPEGEGAGAPLIQDNTFSSMDKPDRRAGNPIDLERLMAQAEKIGESAWLRPKDPAKDLRVQAKGKGAVSVSWQESSDKDIAGYLVRYGTKSNSYLNPTFLGKTNSAEIENLQPGTWYFTVVPYKEGKVECWTLSNEAQVLVE